MKIEIERQCFDFKAFIEAADGIDRGDINILQDTDHDIVLCTPEEYFNDPYREIDGKLLLDIEDEWIKYDTRGRHPTPVGDGYYHSAKLDTVVKAFDEEAQKEILAHFA